jgi:hypothetical protein
MTSPANPDRALLLATYQVERAADTTYIQRNLTVVSLTLVYMGAVSALVSSASDVPMVLLLVLPLPAMALLNELIVNLLVALAHHWYIQKLDQRIADQPSQRAPMEYQFPYWQRYTERIVDPQVAARAFKPLAILWPIMPFATVTVFLTGLIVMAFQRADEFATYGLCVVAATSYLGMLVLGIGTFWFGVRRLQLDFRS